MRYKILESVKKKRTVYELLEYGDKTYVVTKASCSVSKHLFVSKVHDIAYDFFKKAVGY